MRIKGAGRRAFTLIELMIVVIIVAILAAAAVPIYNSFTSRAYGTEVQTALSTLRTAQRAYKAANGSYCDNLDSGDPNLVDEGYISSSDFQDMKYVEFDDLSVSSSDPIATWDDDAGSSTIDGYQYDQVEMKSDGTLDKKTDGAK